MGFFPNYLPHKYEWIDANFGQIFSKIQPSNDMLFSYIFEIDHISYKYERTMYTFEHALPVVGGLLIIIMYIVGVIMDVFNHDLLIFRVL